MTDTTSQASGTNAAPVEESVPDLQPPTPRPILGNVSPNVRTMYAAKPQDCTSSGDLSLKRSLASTLDNDSGFTYLKKRKLANGGPDNPQVSNPVQYTKTSRFSQPTLLDVPTRPADEDAGSDTSVERKSFSSLINYDPSSQNVVSSQDQKKPSRGTSYAQQLKLRLRLATYKMRTDQINVRFNDLRDHTPTQDLPNCSEAEEVIAQLRAEAQLRMPPVIHHTHAHPAPPLALFPAPALHPSNYSSRMLYNRQQRMRSSPPAATTSPCRIPRGIATPAAKDLDVPEEEELTSSIVKGRVAEGLLDLRHAF